MSVIKVNKTKDYTIMSNYHFKERNMSLKAKGLLSLMLSLPEDWDYSIAGLVAICKENETAIKSTLDELKEFGYLEVIKHMPTKENGGRIEYEYIVYEQKIHRVNTEMEVKFGNELIQELEKQGIENLGVEVLGVENPVQYNTNNKELNNKKLNNNKKESEIDVILSNVEDEILRYTLTEFIKMRKSIKKPMTSHALELLIKKLYKMTDDKEKRCEILERSILNGWQDIYEIKTDFKKDSSVVKKSEKYTKEQMGTFFTDLDSVVI